MTRSRASTSASTACGVTRRLSLIHIFAYHVGCEVEFFLFDLAEGGRPRSSDTASYFDDTLDAGTRARDQLVATLLELGIDVDSSHHEVAGGQHEIDLAQFVLGPERAGSTMTDRRILLLGGLIGVGFTLFIVLAVVITILLERR